MSSNNKKEGEMKSRDEIILEGCRKSRGFFCMMGGYLAPLPPKKRTLLMFYHVGFAVVTYALVFQILVSIFYAKDFALIMEIVQLFVALTDVVTCSVLLMFHKESFDMVFYYVGLGFYKYPGMEDTCEQAATRKVNKNVLVKITNAFSILLVSCLGLYIVTPFIQQRDPQAYGETGVNIYMPMPATFPFYTETGWGYFWGYMIEVVMAISLTLYLTARDLSFVCLAIQLITEFQVLQLSIRDIDKRACVKLAQKVDRPVSMLTSQIKDIYSSSAFQDCLYECLRENIQHYQLLVRVARQINKFFGYCLLILLSDACMLMGSSGYLLAMKGNRTEDVVKYFLTLSSSLSHTLQLCWVAEKLATESGKIFEELYNTKWYDCNHKFKVCLHLAMCSSRVPVKTTSKYIKIEASMETFNSICSSSYSLFNLLRQSNK